MSETLRCIREHKVSTITATAVGTVILVGGIANDAMTRTLAQRQIAALEVERNSMARDVADQVTRALTAPNGVAYHLSAVLGSVVDTRSGEVYTNPLVLARPNMSSANNLGKGAILGVNRPAADGRPHYVALDFDPTTMAQDLRTDPNFLSTDAYARAVPGEPDMVVAFDAAGKITAPMNSDGTPVILGKVTPDGTS